jgi:hypothetical protein
MSDLIGKIKGKIDKGISKVNVGSKKLIEKQKIKLQISEFESSKKILLLELGKLTHLMLESSEQAVDKLVDKSGPAKSTTNIKPDKWEQSILSVLKSICEGRLDNILFENTENEFKITAKSLSAEVEKSLPKSEKKEQNLQWLGRVIAKFGITSRKYSKRINRERETVYEFDKLKTIAALDKVSNNNKTKPLKKNKDVDYKELMLSKSREINTLDTKIKNLESKLLKVKS